MVKTEELRPKGAAGRRALLRHALVDAAERAIAREGLAGIRARALAQEAGCAVGAIYNVVADLDDLVVAVNLRTLKALDEQLKSAARVGIGTGTGAGEAAAPPGPHPEAAETPADRAIARLVRLALAYLDFAANHKQRWRALFDHRTQAGREIPDWYVAEKGRLFTYVEEPLRDLTQSSADQRAILARSLFSAVHGIVVLGLEEKLQLLPPQLLREQMALVVTAAARGLMMGA